MGYMSAIGNCATCGTIFDFNPELVPSIRGYYDARGVFTVSEQGHREPVCRACVETLNRGLKKYGRPPIEILPGAYEPAEDLI
jgi:hypothetical protein